MSNRRSAVALANPLRRRIVLACIPRERTVGELTTALQTDLKRVHYHVTALTGLGLLKISGSRRRAGRAAILYRASAPAFFVPAEFAVEFPAAMLKREMEDALLAARREAGRGFLYHVEESGRPKMQTVTVCGAPSAAAEIWRVLALSRGDAQQLSKEMAILLNGYAGRNGGRWLVHFAMCPSPAKKIR